MPRGIEWVKAHPEECSADARTESERQDRLQAILAVVFILAMAALMGVLRYADHWKQEQTLAEEAAFVAAADRAAREVPATFASWHESTSKGGQVFDWNGASASVFWIEKRVYGQGRTAQFVVWAVTPNKRYFTVSFNVGDDWKLNHSGKFQERAVDDVVRELNAAGQASVIAKLGLVRNPA